MTTKLTPERYELNADDCGDNCMTRMSQVADGLWVKYSEYAARITALDEELKAAQEQTAMLQQTLETRAQRELEMIGIVQRESVTECIEVVTRLRDVWEKAVEQDSHWTPWVNAANKIITALSTLQGKAPVNEQGALCGICLAAGRVYCPPEHSVEAPVDE